MKLLFLTAQPPYPPRQGGALRAWGFISRLAVRHEIHLLAFGEGGPVPPGVTRMDLIPTSTRSRRDRLRDLLRSREPDMARRLASTRFHQALESQLARESFDYCIAVGLEMAPRALPFTGRPGPTRWIYDALNAETELQRTAMWADWRRPSRWIAAAYSTVQVRRLARYEQALLRRFDLTVAVSQEDARLLAALAPVEPLVVPNGVDTGLLAPERFVPAPALRRRAGPAIVFTGKMDYRPNVDGVLWFVDEILPRIRVAGPPPTFWIVGQQPHAALDRLRSHPQVVLTGFVDEVEPYVLGADLNVVPLRMGSGTRLKVLQALSLARPLLGTPLGCAGLALEDGRHARLASEPAALARAAADLLADPEGAAALGRAGRAYVQAHFDWEILVPRLEEHLLQWHPGP